jgi:hypothetical protein
MNWPDDKWSRLVAETLQKEERTVTTIRPLAFSIENEPGVGVDISVDFESSLNGPLFFIVGQDGQEVFVTLECLRGLVMAAEQLVAARKK